MAVTAYMNIQIGMMSVSYANSKKVIPDIITFLYAVSSIFYTRGPFSLVDMRKCGGKILLNSMPTRSELSDRSIVFGRDSTYAAFDKEDLQRHSVAELFYFLWHTMNIQTNLA